MNVHILPDNKFNKNFVPFSSGIGPFKNEYLSIPKSDSGPRFPVEDVQYFKSVNDILDKLKIETPRRIYVHGLWEWRSKLLKEIESQSPITWVLYGVGVYKRLPFKKLYEPRTRPLKHFGKEKMTLLDWVRLFRRVRPNLTRYLQQRSTLSKLDSIAFWLRHDYESIVKTYFLNIDFIEFRYGDPVPFPHSARQEVGTVSSLLLGNSADPSNNHLDALYKISNTNFEGKIYCPLSYSGSQDYTSKVVDEGKRLFGANFVPLLEYIPKKEYFDLVDDVDAALFYHRRQQAGNNIAYFLRSGKPVFLHPRSPLFPYFKEMKVDLVQPTTKFGDGLHISKSQVEKSRTVIEKWLSHEIKKARFERLLTY